MEISKRSKCYDQLSELPDSLILHILSFLPMRDVVRTTLLSKRWKDLWTTIPCLIFEGDTERKLCTNKFRDFVNRAMLLWKGSKILKFEVNCLFEECYSSDLDMWLHVAMEKEVEELDIDLVGLWDLDASVLCEYFAPQRLFSCSSIRKLLLWRCGLKVEGNVQWNQLKSLRIHGVCLSEHVMNQVLSGAPQLEVLILKIVESFENLNIQSSSLKRLKIDKDLDVHEVDVDDIDLDAAMHTTLRIWAPNVETLEITGYPYGKCLLMNISSITRAVVRFYLPEFYERFPGYELVKEILGQVLQTSSHLEEVTLSDWCIEVLGDMNNEHKEMLAPLSNAKFVKLSANAHEVNKIASLFVIFPKLTTLVLENSSLPQHEDYHGFEILRRITEPFVPKFDAKNSLECSTNVPGSYHLLHLRIVEITWIVRDNSIFPFAKILLKYASKLEKMVFRVVKKFSYRVPPDCLFLAAQKLLSMPRTSPTAEGGSKDVMRWTYTADGWQQRCDEMDIYSDGKFSLSSQSSRNSLFPNGLSNENAVKKSGTSHAISVSELGTESCSNLIVSAQVRATSHGEMAGKHATLLFVRSENEGNGYPRKRLVGFESVRLSPGETQDIEFAINPFEHLSYTNEDGLMIIEEGTVYLVVGDEEYPINVVFRC